MKRILIYGSSREDGNTAAITAYLAGELGIESVSLGELNIAPFSYQNSYPEGDDFMPLMERLVGYDEWLLLSPVYWYSMSAQMKTFFDRHSDILRHRPDLKARIQGTSMWAISCGSDAEETPGFYEAFRLTAKYLHMQYQGHLHTWLGRTPSMKPEVKTILDRFIAQIQL